LVKKKKIIIIIIILQEEERKKMLFFFFDISAKVDGLFLRVNKERGKKGERRKAFYKGKI
jgi:hypothetical protein